MKPALLFYCQHSLGMGHLIRSLAVAEALTAYFRVVLLSGGPLPAGMRLPEDVEIVALPPLGLAPGSHDVISRDRETSVDLVRRRRRQLILDAFDAALPHVVIVELFPFGRKKFADEIVPLLDRARSAAGPRRLILCSVRDILVSRRADQPAHDDRASQLANHYFDAVLVHADPTLARLEDSFRPRSPLRVPVHYTGLVAAGDVVGDGSEPQPVPECGRPIVVSAGGGLVGEPLLRTAIEAHALTWPSSAIPMKIISGPFIPERAWQSLATDARARPGLELRRYVPDLCAELRSAAASVSQCGYNTALDILRAGIPALVVPFARESEDEQMTRARRLEGLGALRVLDPGRLDPPTLAAEIHALLEFQPRRLSVDLDGARTTAHLVAKLSGVLASETRRGWPRWPR